MKAHLFLLLIIASLSGFCQSYSTLNLYSRDMGSSAVVSVFLNDELAGSVRDNEHLQCKLYSAGRVTVTVSYPQAYIRRTSIIDIEKGKTYYMIMKNNYNYFTST